MSHIQWIWTVLIWWFGMCGGGVNKMKRRELMICDENLLQLHNHVYIVNYLIKFILMLFVQIHWGQLCRQSGCTAKGLLCQLVISCHPGWSHPCCDALDPASAWPTLPWHVLFFFLQITNLVYLFTWEHIWQIFNKDLTIPQWTGDNNNNNNNNNDN